MTILRRKQPYRVPPLHSRWTRRRRQLPEPPPGPGPPPEPDYHLAGTITPDATGEYSEDGTCNVHPKYIRTDSAWTLWRKWYGPPFMQYRWHITCTCNSFVGPHWLRKDPNPLGEYQPYNGAIGTATVTEP